MRKESGSLYAMANHPGLLFGPKDHWTKDQTQQAEASNGLRAQCLGLLQMLTHHYLSLLWLCGGPGLHPVTVLCWQNLPQSTL